MTLSKYCRSGLFSTVVCQFVILWPVGNSKGAGQQTEEVVASRIPRAETGLEQDHLTGDWGGQRTKLVEQGIHFSFGYTGEFLSNVSGGLKRGSVADGLIELGLDIDPGKTSSWKGGLFHVSALYPHGAGFSFVMRFSQRTSWIAFLVANSAVALAATEPDFATRWRFQTSHHP